MLLAEVAARRPARRDDPRLLPRRRRHPRPVRSAAVVAAAASTTVDVADRDVAVELAAARPATEFLPGALDQWSAPRPRRTSRSRACRSDETGQGAPRRRRDPGRVLGRPRRVARRARHAHDVPHAAGDACAPASSARRRAAAASSTRSTSAGSATRCSSTAPSCRSAPTFTVALGPDGWEVDGGLVHGFRDPVGDEAFVLACTDDDGTVAGVVRVTARRDRAVARRAGRLGAGRRRLPAVVVAVPLPPAEVQLDPPTDGGAGGRRCRRRAPAPCAPPSPPPGPGGTPSTSVRVVDATTASPGALRLRVAVPAARHRPHHAGPTAARSSATSPPPTAPVPGSSSAASSTSPRGSRSAASATTRRRSPTLSTLDLYAVDDDERRRPDDRQPLPADGSCVLTYRPRPDGSGRRRRCSWSCATAPTRDLYVAVLDLTDRFRCHARPPDRPARRRAHRSRCATAIRSRRRCPPDEPVVPGAAVRDWLKVIVSDVDFDAVVVHDATARPAAAPHAVGEGVPLDARPARRPGGQPRRRRGDRTTPAAQWAASTLLLEVRVP